MTNLAATGRMEYVKSVLLIDDNPSCNFIMREFIKLADAAIEVYEAESVDDAMNILVQANAFPDVIYVDLNMPVKNGFDFIEEFEKGFLPQHRDTKIFMLSSSLREEDKQSAMIFESVADFVNKNEIDSFLQTTLLRSEVS